MAMRKFESDIKPGTKVFIKGEWCEVRTVHSSRVAITVDSLEGSFKRTDVKEYREATYLQLLFPDQYYRAQRLKHGARDKPRAKPAPSTRLWMVTLSLGKAIYNKAYKSEAKADEAVINFALDNWGVMPDPLTMPADKLEAADVFYSTVKAKFNVSLLEFMR